MERLKTRIQVGEKYLNREGIEMHVIEKIEGSFAVTNPEGVYRTEGYSDGYFVRPNGGFGNTPNYRDLVQKI